MSALRAAGFSAIVAALALAIASACTSLPPPAERPEEEEPGDGGRDAEVADAAHDLDGATARCRGGGWRSLRGVGFIMDGDKAGTQTLMASGAWTEGDAGPVIYRLLVTGVPQELVGHAPVDLGSDANADLATCAYCALASGSCVQVSADAIRCDGDYQATAGQARAVTVPTEDGGSFWVELGNVVLARVRRRDGFAIREIDPSDCIALDRLTLHGTALRIERPCSPAYELLCQVADTAGQR